MAPESPIRWRIFEASYVRRWVALLGVPTFFAIPAGLLTGNEDVFSAMFAFVVAWIALRAFLALTRAGGEDQRWITALCEIGFLVRSLAATAIYSGPWDRYRFSEDQSGYDHLPALIAAYWSGAIFRPPFLDDPDFVARSGYFYFVAAQYFVLGVSFLVPRIFNSLAGALIALYAYRLALIAFGRTEARVAAVWCTLFPSLILWSSLNMRDIWLAVSILAIVYHATRSRDRFSLGSVAIIAGNLLFLQYTRFYLVLIMVAAVAATILLARSGKLARDLVVGFFFLVVVVGLRSSFGVGQDSLEWLDLDKIAQRRNVMARADVGMSGYLPGVDLADPFVMVGFLPFALAYFLYSPFPWQLTAFRRIILIPELLIWWWMLPSLLRSVRDILRTRAGRQLAILLPTAVVTLAFSVTSSNVGLAYRYRAQVIGLLLILVAAGYVRRRTELELKRRRANER